MERPTDQPEPPTASEPAPQPASAAGTRGTQTLDYEPPAGGRSWRGDWGTLTFGDTRISVRLALLIAGIVLWLGTLLVRTGEAGIAQIWASILFFVPLVALGSLTRTISLRWLALMLFAGGALMGVMYLLAVIVIIPLLEFSRPRDFVVPALEQLLVVLPPVVLVWRWRDGRAWSLGATDLLLAGVAVGIGFALVEESYLRAAGSAAYLGWLPVAAEDSGRIVGGHPIWAGLAGATLGLGLLLRSRGPMWLAVAASGSLVGFVDHAAHNNTVTWGDELAGLLNAITVNGWLPVVVFLGLAVACIGADLRIQRQLEPAPHRSMPPRAAGLDGMRDGWGFILERRALAFARHQWWQAATGFAREQSAQTAAALEASLVMRQPERVRGSTEALLEEDGMGVLFPSIAGAIAGSGSSPSAGGSSSEAHGS